MTIRFIRHGPVHPGHPRLSFIIARAVTTPNFHALSLPGMTIRFIRHGPVHPGHPRLSFIIARAVMTPNFHALSLPDQLRA